MELSLSLDNLLVITLIFAAFRIPAQLQHRVLFYGILGALVMRGVMIGLGAELIREYNWVLYVFGAFLVFTGVKMLFAHRAAVHPEKNPILGLVRKCYPVSKDFDGPHFMTRVNQRRALTPLAMVLILVESSDVIFALDSVPAVFSVTRDAFIVFTSNVFAIVGLRSLYFLLAGALDYFRHLKFGLAIILAFVGAKMLVEPHGHEPLWFQFEISSSVALLVIGSILVLAMGSSALVAWREKRASP